MYQSLASSYEDMRFAVEEAQEKMGLDVIDIFLIHEVRQDPDWDMRQLPGNVSWISEKKES